MEIHQVDHISNETLNNPPRTGETRNTSRETERAEQTEPRGKNTPEDAYQVELSEEARRRQAEEQQAAESEQQNTNRNATYNAAGEIAG